MERERREENAQGPPVDWRRCDDATVLAGMRRGWGPAYAEFFERFSALLVALARRAGVSAPDRMQLATEFLDDVAFRLGTTISTIPGTMAAYLAVGFRRHIALVARAESRQERRHDALLESVSGGLELAVRELCSEYSVRASSGDEEVDDPLDDDVLHELRRALALQLHEGASADDQRLLGYLCDGMPQREIARIFGVTHGALRIRVMRLRVRLMAAAAKHLQGLDVDHQSLLARSIGARGRERREEKDGER